MAMTSNNPPPIKNHGRRETFESFVFFDMGGLILGRNDIASHPYGREAMSKFNTNT
jgi:hypothetical protein